ncbi:alpha/beta fold hydrolase [Rhodococcus hoagii]|nr:alpha/beta fold hydrolase [Prescottella equi]
MDTLDYADTTRGPSATDKLHFHEAGEGHPLVLLHGSGPGVSGWSNFSKNLPVFRARLPHHRRRHAGVRREPRHGVRPAVPRGRRRNHRHTARRSRHREGAPLGNSMGGWVALETAALAPDRVDRMALMGPGGLYAPLLGPMMSEGARRLNAFLVDPTREALEAWVDSMVYDPATITPQLLDERWPTPPHRGRSSACAR